MSTGDDRGLPTGLVEVQIVFLLKERDSQDFLDFLLQDLNLKWGSHLSESNTGVAYYYPYLSGLTGPDLVYW